MIDLARRLSAVLVLVIIALGPTNALAKSAPPTGITISPAFQQVTINPNQSEAPIKFTVTNDKSQTQVLTLSAADFNTLNESGGLLFVGSNPTELQKKYGLAKYINLPVQQLTLAPKQTQTINASILNLGTLSSGGHYGALMLAVSNTDLGPAINSVAVHPVASSLLFVTKLGGDTHKLALAGVSHAHNRFSLPSNVTLRFKNNGNTHLIPRGTVIITNSQGKLISKGVINDSSGIILPETFREYTVVLQKVQSAGLAGKYKLSVNYRFDGFDQFRTYQESLSLFPALSIFILPSIAVLALVLAKSKAARRQVKKLLVRATR